MQILLVQSEIVDEGIDDEAIEVQRTNVVVVGRGPTRLGVDLLVASGHAQHRTWCDACMRARGIARRHKGREHCREDEDPDGAIDCGYLQLDGTENDDDDDNEMAQNKLLILVAKEVKKPEGMRQLVFEKKE